jgi:hypothetical protein
MLLGLDFTGVTIKEFGERIRWRRMIQKIN